MKIIASDYDGTLNHGGIDDKKRNAIKEWREKGNKFGIVSGRVSEDLLMIYNKDKFEADFLLACNGAVILTTDGKILKETRCNGEIAKPLLDFIFNLGATWAVIESDNKYVIDEDEAERLPDEFTRASLPEIPYFNQISTILTDDKEAERIANAIKEKFGDKLNPLQNGRCIDIVSATMNKAQGLYDYLELVGGKYEDMITVGDNTNDTHMIKEFRSYAMANGVQSIKDIADYETKGIIELIEKEI
ncbi:MAG: HAD-IIB family hydrolase [Ruminococcaceae bacterium]|nr:HAD-IIB family hydrolase [Oscillospiraceae bacterium]